MLLKRLNRRRFLLKYACALGMLCFFYCCFSSRDDTKDLIRDALLSSSFSSSSSSSSSSFASSRHLLAMRNCTPPAVDQFPKDLFSQQERKRGAFLVHLLVALYMFVGLALVCDDYFVPACEKFCNVLNLSEDVAGTTFMAAGSSAPELATVVIGVFITKDDIALGSVIGSAVFNIMMVIGLCGLFAGMVVHLKWWPMCRDSACYLISILVLVFVIVDELVYWYEALIMLLLYVLYIVLMYFNPKIEHHIESFVQKRKKQSLVLSEKVIETSNSDEEGNEDVQFTRHDYSSKSGGVTRHDKMLGDGTIERFLGESENNNEINNHKINKNKNMFKNNVPTNKSKKKMGKKFNDGENVTVYHELASYNSLSSEEDNIDKGNSQSMMNRKGMEKDDDADDDDDNNDDDDVTTHKPNDDDDDDPSVWTVPKSKLKRLFWVLCLPLTALMYITVPNCRISFWSNWYTLTFLLSCIWIAFYVYIMVWMITILGFTFGVPDSVMGLTFIAAGSSMPDSIASLIVVRAGQGDMAVSNAIGSNIFDILICLGLPWLLQTLLHKPHVPVPVFSEGLVYTALILLGTVFLLVVLTHLNGWRLTKAYGLLLLFFYVAFNVVVSLFELNIFGYMNPPECLSIYNS